MGKIILITGPNESGKSTLAKILEEKHGIKEVISHTTRAPRSGEVDGVNYHFVSHKKFKKIPMVEAVEYDGNFYGTFVKGIQEALSSDKPCCIVAELEGCRKLKQFCGEENMYQVFIYCNKGVLKKRMSNRGDSREKIKNRLVLYERDMQEKYESDYCILNHGPMIVFEATV